jgi:hypothetical protein
MKHVILIALSLVVSTAAAHDTGHERVLYQASELVPWCKSETEARYVALGFTPYQWASSYHDASNVLYVDGRLRVHDADVVVRCRIARGAREQYAIIEIDDPTMRVDVP